MTLRPSDFATYREALEYANTRLDEWRERFRDLEDDMISLDKNPTLEDLERIKTKWQERATELQEVET